MRVGPTQTLNGSESEIVLLFFRSDTAKSFISKPNLLAYSISFRSIKFIPSVSILFRVTIPPKASSESIAILSAAS